MLMLSRKTGEQIVIGGNIVLTISDAGHGRVKLGFVAPHDVRIDRMEVHQERLHGVAKGRGRFGARK